MNNYLNNTILEFDSSRGHKMFLCNHSDGEYALLFSKKFTPILEVLNFVRLDEKIIQVRNPLPDMNNAAYIFSKKFKPDIEQIFNIFNTVTKKSHASYYFDFSKKTPVSNFRAVPLSSFDNITEVYDYFRGMENSEVIYVEIDDREISSPRTIDLAKGNKILLDITYPFSQILKLREAREYVREPLIELNPVQRLVRESDGVGNRERIGIRVKDSQTRRLRSVEKYANPEILDRRVNKCKSDLCGSSLKGILDDGTAKCGLCGCDGHSRNNCACPSCGIVNTHTCSDCPILDAQYQSLIRAGKKELCNCTPAGVCAACKESEECSFLIIREKNDIKIQSVGPSVSIGRKLMVLTSVPGRTAFALRNLFDFFFNTKKYDIEGLFPTKFFTNDVRKDLKFLFNRDANTEVNMGSVMTGPDFLHVIKQINNFDEVKKVNANMVSIQESATQKKNSQEDFIPVKIADRPIPTFSEWSKNNPPSKKSFRGKPNPFNI